jgi:hypothetical protein
MPNPRIGGECGPFRQRALESVCVDVMSGWCWGKLQEDLSYDVRVAIKRRLLSPEETIEMASS